MDIKDIKDLIITMDHTSIERVEIEKGDTKVIISKGVSNKHTKSDTKTSNEIKVTEDREVIKNEESLLVEEDLYTIKSPMVGVYYEAPSPDEDAFVRVGDRLEEGQTVCILEAMKLMNEIEAEVAGEVVEILVKNEDIVEYGQALMRIRR